MSDLGPVHGPQSGPTQEIPLVSCRLVTEENHHAESTK